MDNPTLEIELATQPIELCKLLKAVDLVSGGGEAKMVISEGYVYLNGVLETQKRKKIYHNDRIEFNGECIIVICHAPVDVKPIKIEKTKKRASENKKAANAKNKNASRKNQSTNVENTNKPVTDISGNRKPINF
ncbi:RNA-binding S4 domain-containing protein [Thalassotalea piscium]|uniref:Ribosome-associated protein n=1 Tax=Thalassotalea piscium TaxID=1230533 RepID=A0A7X0TSU8_9GAMM|nr:RNA-binding S4 domain-containing protein [Thalassotalea piscium]MBB6542506.1 ribosome-associated protein [Thalassotalea piscium]